MGGHQHDPPGGVGQGCRQVLVGWRDPAVDGHQEGVDDRVSGDTDDLGIGALSQEVVPAAGGRTQVQRGHLADETPVGLLGEGRGDVAGAQAGLNVKNRDLVVEGGERRGEGGGGISLDHDGIGPVGLDRPPHPLQGAVGDLGEGLSRRVDVEVVVGHDAEEVVDLVEHLAVLSGDDHDRVEALVVAHGGHQGSKLDRLRAGAVDEHDPKGAARWGGVCCHEFSCSGALGRERAEPTGGPARWWLPRTGLTGPR